MYQRYYIQLGNIGNIGLGSVFAVTADNDADAIEEAAALAASVAPGLFVPADDSTFIEFPEDFIETESGVLASDEVHFIYSRSVESGRGKFFRESRFMPNSARFYDTLAAIRRGALS